MTVNLFSHYPDAERRFFENALVPGRGSTAGARLQRIRVFGALNDELAGPGLKYVDLARRVGSADAMEIYTQNLVEHGIRPARTMGASHD